MENQPPSLGEQFAGLRSDAQAGRENCVWLPAAIHAAIAAIFARIFGRLEQLLALWQVGTLPPPAPAIKRQRLIALASHARPRRAGTPAFRPRAPHAQTANPLRTNRRSDKRSAIRLFLPAPDRSTLGIKPASRPRPGRDPPSPAAENAPRRHSPLMPDLLRYNN